MRVLYVIFVLSVAALVWAAIAAARHIRRHETQRKAGAPRFPPVAEDSNDPNRDVTGE